MIPIAKISEDGVEKMNKSEIISWLEDLVRDRKDLLNNEPSDDIFIYDIAILKAAIVVIEKYVPEKPFMNPMNLFSLLQRCDRKEFMSVLRKSRVGEESVRRKFPWDRSDI